MTSCREPFSLIDLSHSDLLAGSTLERRDAILLFTTVFAGFGEDGGYFDPFETQP